MSELKPYRSGGARALVLLHDRHLRSFVDTWFQAQAAGVVLPETDDPSYVSMEALLRHVLRAARGYMTWFCQVLELPEPGIRKTPETDTVEAEADSYLTHLLEQWRLPLADVDEPRFHQPTFASRWGVHYCIDAMLEHAVMHPIRHSFQLAELMRAQA